MLWTWVLLKLPRLEELLAKKIVHTEGISLQRFQTQFWGCRGLYAGFPDRRANFVFVFPSLRPATTTPSSWRVSQNDSPIATRFPSPTV
jgi:hypothetical protein